MSQLLRPNTYKVHYQIAGLGNVQWNEFYGVQFCDQAVIGDGRQRALALAVTILGAESVQAVSIQTIPKTLTHSDMACPEIALNDKYAMYGGIPDCPTCATRKPAEEKAQ